MSHPPGDPVARLMAKVATGDGCWNFTGLIQSNGYAKFYLNRKLWWAHRAAYHLLVGPIPAGLQVCHKCDNPRCVRPDHLFLGTQSDNMIDKVRKGRDHQTRKTHCPAGHEFTPENTISFRQQPGRGCRACRDRRCNEFYQRSKARALGAP